MGEEIVISLKKISKCYKQYDHPVDRIKEILLRGKNYAQEFWALQNISLEVPQGETLGVIGQNGSGKSTLLQIIAGTLTPTTGEIYVNGRISALLELGSGFNPEFTGRQNVFFNGRLLGLSQRNIEDKFDEIAKFADIGDFIDQPVKTYSSGMFIRLAFAVAVSVNPNILIVDEALAVGDIYFQQKCFLRIKELKELGTTILFVSHDSTAVYKLCNRAVLLEAGQVVLDSKPRQVIDLYEARLLKKNDVSQEKLEIQMLSDLTYDKIQENRSNSVLPPEQLEEVVINLPEV
ncbi:MAG: ABC transporter ATP-binding protein, partial [Brasilonema sp.]